MFKSRDSMLAYNVEKYAYRQGELYNGSAKLRITSMDCERKYFAIY